MTHPKKSEKPQGATSEKLKPEQRIRKTSTFQFLFKNGQFTKGKNLNLWVYRDEKGWSGPGGPKLGIVVSRKTHANATVRNLWKRRIREAFRKIQNKQDPKNLILLQSRYGKKIPPYQEILEEVEQLLAKVKNKE